MEVYFDHEKLKVYQKAIEFVKWSDEILSKIKTKNTVADQFDRALTSIALNIAEGNGKYFGKDRCRYFDIARGSA
jgi:four helix bundle protein